MGPSGKRSTRSGARGQQRGCPSGLEKGPAKKLEMQRLLKVKKQRRKQLWKKKKRKKKRRRRKRRSKYHSHKHSQSLICQSIPDWIWRSSCRHQTDICDFPVQVVDPMKNINRLCIFTSH